MIVETLEQQWQIESRLNEEQRQEALVWYTECRDIVYENLDRWKKEIQKIDEVLNQIERQCCFIWQGKRYSSSFKDRKVLRELANLCFLFDENKKVLQKRIHDLNRILTITTKKQNRNDEIDVEEIKSISIRYILQKYNIQVRGKMAHCPIRKEKSPSFIVYDNTNSFNCFGCHEGGTVIDLIMKIESCDFKEAIKILQTL